MKRKIVGFLGLALVWVLLFQGGVYAFDGLGGKQGEAGVKKAVSYLHTMQNPDGGFFAKKGGESSKGITCWVVMALAAAGEDLESSSWAPGGKSPFEFLKNSPQDMDGTTDYARLLLAYAALGQSSSPEAQELAAKIISFQQADGQFWQENIGETGMINSHVWSVLALAASGKEIPHQEKAKNWLISKQNADGGFGWLEGGESDADDTGVVIQALIRLGEKKDSVTIKNALEFIKGLQQESGGFSAGEWMGKEANASSDAWVFQGLLAAGENPTAEKWTKDGKNLITHLMSLQQEDGSFYWREGINSSTVTTTAHGLITLSGKSFPQNLSDGGNNKESDPGVSFTDLSLNYWAYDSIKVLVEAGVLGGYPDGSFKPENSVTRAEFTKFIIKGLGFPEGKSNSAARFNDISQQHWAWSFISAAVDRGYINGMGDGTFGLNGKITGAELAAILVRALPEGKKAGLQEGSKWYSGYVALALKEGLLYPDFKESVGATRAQCAFSIDRLAKIISVESRK